MQYCFFAKMRRNFNILKARRFTSRGSQEIMGSINVPSVSMKLLKTVKYVLELQVISIHEHGGLRMVRSLL